MTGNTCVDKKEGDDLLINLNGEPSLRHEVVTAKITV